MKIRTTKRVNLLTMKLFTVVDDWTQGSNSHKLMEFPWVGSTTFKEVEDFVVFEDEEDSSKESNSVKEEVSKRDRRASCVASLSYKIKDIAKECDSTLLKPRYVQDDKCRGSAQLKKFDHKDFGWKPPESSEMREVDREAVHARCCGSDRGDSNVHRCIGSANIEYARVHMQYRTSNTVSCSSIANAATVDVHNGYVISGANKPDEIAARRRSLGCDHNFDSAFALGGKARLSPVQIKPRSIRVLNDIRFSRGVRQTSYPRYGLRPRGGLDYQAYLSHIEPNYQVVSTCTMNARARHTYALAHADFTLSRSVHRGSHTQTFTPYAILSQGISSGVVAPDTKRSQ